METKIVRNDTGLDFKRIEQIIKLFQDKANKLRRTVSSEKAKKLKEREKESFSHFGLIGDLEAIKEIDIKIENLKNERRLFESKVRDYTQGTEENNRYNSYDTIREKSPIHEYINQETSEYEEREKCLSSLSESIEEELWLAKNISQAVEIYQKYSAALESEMN